MEGLAWMGVGAWQGRGGRGTCVFLHKNVHRNRLECSFRAACQESNRHFSLIFFREVLDFPLNILDFSQGKNPAKSRGKSGMITCCCTRAAGTHAAAE